VAGELTGVGGAKLALVTGRLAGEAAAGQALTGSVVDGHPDRLARRRRLIGFAETLHAAHPVRPGWTDWLDADTLVCRCEEVPLARLDHAITQLGATDPRTAKLLTRCGMGWCQGRICAEAVSTLVASRTGRPVELTARAAAASRPVAVPITLAALAARTAPTALAAPAATPPSPPPFSP
jgi:NAD(P)H-nitrite reductase large subunit